MGSETVTRRAHYQSGPLQPRLQRANRKERDDGWRRERRRASWYGSWVASIFLQDMTTSQENGIFDVQDRHSIMRRGEREIVVVR
jgi:hypothetical protein